MIKVVCSNDTYTYNAYHLTKAFFPSQEVKSCVEETASAFVSVQLENGKQLTVSDAELSLTRAEALSLEKSVRKNLIDKALYRKLTAETGIQLSWGILTGVRPTKIAMEKLEEGMEEETFVPWLMEDCLVSREKASLAYEVARRESALLDSLDLDNGYSLYVGIPFCPSVCAYCSFSSGALSAWQDSVEDYLTALQKELTFIGEAEKDRPLNTIYIGGGTPTTLSVDQLEDLLTLLDQLFPRGDLLEYTVEAGRPDCITAEKLQVLRQHHVTRISVNPQTMQQKTLDVIGRKHTVEDVVDAFSLARKMGFTNINMDLIAGLPGENLADFTDTLAQISALDPDNLTIHSLAIKRASRFGQAHNVASQGQEISQMIAAGASCAEELDMAPYYLYRQKNMAGNFENVGYAKVDKAGIYNILIMEEKQSIIAAGAGATTKLVLKGSEASCGRGSQETQLKRIENVKAIDTYIQRVDEMIQRKETWLCR